MATGTLVYFPKRSKPTGNKHPKEKCSVLNWVRNGYVFPGQPAPECGAPVPFPPLPEPTPEPPKPKPKPEPEKPEGGAQ